MPHRNFIAIGRGVVIFDDQDYTYRIEPLHIVSVDDIEPEQSSNGT